MLICGGRSLEAPFTSDPDEFERSIFLAGGITDCPNWQNEAVTKILNETIGYKIKPLLLNPRRRNFDVTDQKLSRNQIEWEYANLTKANAILFWFPKETLCPITLYELGFWAASRKPLFVGVDPDYKRREDILIQMGLARPNIVVRLSLDGVTNDCLNFLKQENFDNLIKTTAKLTITKIDEDYWKEVDFE